MKKAIHILLSLFLSALIFYGGSGVNVFFFCCDKCQAEKATVVAIFVGIQCCSDSQKDSNNACCSRCQTEGEVCCSVDRIEFDWQLSSRNQTQLQPLSNDLDSSIFLLAHKTKPTTDALLLYRLLNRQSQIPPHLSKNDYFDLLCTLII
jgi:hypothetical protein